PRGARPDAGPPASGVLARLHPGGYCWPGADPPQCGVRPAGGGVCQAGEVKHRPQEEFEPCSLSTADDEARRNARVDGCSWNTSRTEPCRPRPWSCRLTTSTPRSASPAKWTDSSSRSPTPDG